MIFIWYLAQLLELNGGELQKVLSAGEYEITAEFSDDGSSWLQVNGSGTTFSINPPTVSYVIPSGSGNYVKFSDNPLRVRVEDQYNQFKQVKYEIYNTSDVLQATHIVLRNDCDLRQAGNYLLCDVKNSATWSALTDGTYYAKATTYTMANNRFDNLVSDNFIVDNAKPVVSNVMITNPVAYFTTHIDMSADTSDNNALDTAKFFITAPRVSDGACDGNGAHVVENIESLGGVSSITATTSLNLRVSNGTHCVNVSAKDFASNNSNIVGRIKVEIDNIAPETTINSNPASLTYSTAGSIYMLKVTTAQALVLLHLM